jgi:hypothetical protein
MNMVPKVRNTQRFYTTKNQIHLTIHSRATNHCFFYPQYARHYADAELTLLALQAGVYAYEPNSILVEVDWDKDHASVDSHDRTVFAQRKAQHFDGKVTQAVLLDLIA